MKLIFIYNADGTYASRLYDAAHKIVSPDTYQCNLCVLTYGTINMRKKWRDFIKSAPADIRFLHKDEFQHEFPNSKVEYPVVLMNTDSVLTEVISAKELNAMKTVDELVSATRKIIKKYDEKK